MTLLMKLKQTTSYGKCILNLASTTLINYCAKHFVFISSISILLGIKIITPRSLNFATCVARSCRRLPELLVYHLLYRCQHLYRPAALRCWCSTLATVSRFNIFATNELMWDNFRIIADNIRWRWRLTRALEGGHIMPPTCFSQIT